MKKNAVHNHDFLCNDLPDNCANLIIADPPYYEVKGDFDFVFKILTITLSTWKRGQKSARAS